MHDKMDILKNIIAPCNLTSYSNFVVTGQFLRMLLKLETRETNTVRKINGPFFDPDEIDMGSPTKKPFQKKMEHLFKSYT